ncbi:MAG: helix-turn-helix transcriptional regulator [Alistipes sp.]|jgi:AraC-like DNA-binding protein|nr:helix-turn-helix transcriptional regulator [Alistipes sp.]
MEIIVTTEVRPVVATFVSEDGCDDSAPMRLNEVEVVIRLTPRCDGHLKVVDRREVERFSAALQYAVMNNTSMQELAERCCLSLSTFKRRFREWIGGSPYEWIIAKRMAIAYDLLQHTDIAIASLAKICSYRNTSHFIEVFKEYYGITPLALRRQMVSRQHGDDKSMF